MQLTKEQEIIVKSKGDIKINAIAGSGKTTTVVEYAASRPKNSKILYLSFNKSVKDEANLKFYKNGLYNVIAHTAHSLAHKHIVANSSYKVCPGYKVHEIATLLGISSGKELHGEYMVANHVNKFAAYFCNSDKQKIQQLNYLNTVKDPRACGFVEKYYDDIEEFTRKFLAKMDNAEIAITHDFYIKKFQLSNPQLNYDYILFDEGQDASPSMLNVFINQKATKVIVGDTHQQIYGWRYAVNSLENTNFKTYSLSHSFRFSENIANLSLAVLDWKKLIGAYTPTPIIGKGNSNETLTKAILARTNLGLLLKAIEFVIEKKSAKKIYFEGNINSYTYAENGTSLYDVLNLHLNKRHLIKDELIKKMKDLEELETYIKNTEDLQLGMMVELVNKYGKKIPKIINDIKEKHCDNKEDASMIFSTVHKSKGMEYDTVQLVNDFIDDKKIVKYKEDLKEVFDPKKINEEINLLYVAITRTRNKLYIPENLIPENFPESKHIIPLQVEIEEEDEEVPQNEIRNESEKAYTIKEVRKTHPQAYEPWTEELDDKLTIMYCEGVSEKDMAIHFKRTKGAINSRISKLDLENCYR